MSDQDTSALSGDEDVVDPPPQTDDRNDELDESPVPDPEAKDTNAEDDPGAD